MISDERGKPRVMSCAARNVAAEISPRGLTPLVEMTQGRAGLTPLVGMHRGAQKAFAAYLRFLFLAGSGGVNCFILSSVSPLVRGTKSASLFFSSAT